MDAVSIITNPFVWVPTVAIIVIVLLLGIFLKNYIKVPPNKVAVFTGRGKPKVVRGGARLMIPGFERVDYMELEPFNIKIDLKGSISHEGVPVNVEAVGLVRYGSSDEMIQTAIQRFLTTNREALHQQLNEILSGNLRGIVAKMTVEQLNSDREGLAKAVIDEAGTALGKIGIEVDALTIQTISDSNGYLESLGQKRISEVKKDADIGKAIAERETRVQQATSSRESEVAEAEAATAIAEAIRNKDLKLASYSSEVEAEKARAEQAGPLAAAEARKAVLVAEQVAEAARVEANTEVERRRAEQEQQRLQADVIAPAEAQRQASILAAEGERQSQMLKAEADAATARQKGQGDADARKLVAEATQAEGEAAAASLLARLLAEAEGQGKLAESLNLFTPEAVRMQLMPAILKSLVESVDAAAKPLGAIDRVTLIGGTGGNGEASKGGLFGSLTNNSSELIERVMTGFKDNGVDIGALLSGKITPQALAAISEAVAAPQPPVSTPVVKAPKEQELAPAEPALVE